MISLAGYSGRWPGLRGHEPFGSVACWLPVKICIFTELYLSRLIQASLGPPRGRSQAAVAYQLPAETYVSAEFFFHEILEREKDPQTEILPFATADRQAQSALSGALIVRSGIA